MGQINLQELFGNLQQELEVKLGLGGSIPHPTANGDNTEVNWIDMLKSLPGRYVVSGGFVVDSNGNISEQIDAIIYDRYYSPLILQKESVIYVPAESVYAVLEVKPSLSKETLEYAAKKAKSVRGLERISAPIRQIDGSLRRKDTLPPILAGIVTTKADWSPPFGESFVSTLSGLESDTKIDLGIALQSGSFNCTYTDSGAVTVQTSEATDALISFFINLTKQLQLLGNAPGIDLDKYYNCYE